MSAVRFTQAVPMGTASAEEVRELSGWLREMVAFAWPRQRGFGLRCPRHTW